MENIKVSVKHNDWSEVFNMLVELGAITPAPKNAHENNNGWLFVHKGCLWASVLPRHEKECREVTFRELKDIVVLKRNDVNDATHTSGSRKYYLTGSEFYEYFHNKWVNVDEFVDGMSFEPIEKTMKEYLNPDQNYQLVRCHVGKTPVPVSWIEVPEGMNYAYKDDFNVHFTKLEMGYRDSVVIWQRDKDITSNSIETTNTEQTEGNIMKYQEVSSLEAFTAKMVGEEVEYKYEDGGWVLWGDSDSWDINLFKSSQFKFRIVTKQLTIVINAKEVVAPFTPKVGETYWAIKTTNIDWYMWSNDDTDNRILNSTGCYRTKEDAENARNAMCSVIQDYYKSL